MKTRHAPIVRTWKIVEEKAGTFAVRDPNGMFRGRFSDRAAAEAHVATYTDPARHAATLAAVAEAA